MLPMPMTLGFIGGTGVPPVFVTAKIIAPVAIIVLCAVAGIGTVLMLPGRREASMRRIGAVIALVAALILSAIVIRQSAGAGAGEVYFWVFSAITVLAAARVISHPKPVYSALYFVLSVAGAAGLFVLLWAEFMAAALILIYAGAILITYVFVIMLAAQVQSPPESTGEQQHGQAEYDRTSREPVIASAVGFVVMGVVLFLVFDRAAPTVTATPAAGFSSTVAGLGTYLFTDQLVALEVAGLILTLAAVGAIIIARRQVAPASAEPLPPSRAAIEDDPHAIPVYGTDRHEAKAYPES